MSLLSIPRTYGNLKRLQQIAMTLARHGFSHFLGKLRLGELLPGGEWLKSFIGGVDSVDYEKSDAARMVMAIEELGATYIKFGQLLATRPDLIPPAFVKEFSRLQDSVDPMPASGIREVIVKRLVVPIEDVFASFEDKPVASGSIGQVHYAVLKDGRPVIVKVKRPGTDERMREDLSLLAVLADLAEQYLPELEVLRPRMVVDEFQRVMERELDYVGEASYTSRLARDFADDESVTVPEVYWDYVTRDTLVLERIDGVRLTDFEEIQRRGFDQKVLAETLGKLFMRQFFITGFFHADPHPGNIFVKSASKVALIDCGQMGHISDDLRRKLAMMVIALSHGDIDSIVDVFAEIGVFTERTDARDFKGELASLIDRYYGVPIDRMDLGDAFRDALSVARDHGIMLPRDFVLLGKSFVTIASVIRKLDPRFRADEVVKPFAREIFGNIFNPVGMLKRFGGFAMRVSSMLQRAPEDIRDLMEKARSGKLKILFRHDGLDEVIAEVERATNRITVGLLVGAVTIGSSIVLAAGRNALGNLPVPWTETEIPLSAIVASGGFTIAIFMGLWIAWSILRSRRF